MKLAAFLAEHGALPRAEFLSRFTEPFLVEEGRGLGGDRLLLPLRALAGPLKIGRSAGADVTVPHEQVSNRHAVLLPPSAPGQPWRLLDAGSTNGTFVDGAPLEPGAPQSLAPGSRLRFGQATRFLFLAPEQLLQLLARLRDTGKVLRPGERPGSAPGGLSLHSPETGSVPLKVDRPLVLGRTAGSADVVLPHEQVSRRHCEVALRPDGVYVRDLGSANGTFICDVPVGAAPVLLLPDKPLRVGPFQLTLLAPEERDPGQTQPLPTVRPGAALEGRLEACPARELLEQIEAERRSGTLTLETPEGGGWLSFAEGVPHRAVWDGDLRGEAAALKLLRGSAGSYRFEEGAPADARELRLTVGELLLDDFFTEASAD